MERLFHFLTSASTSFFTLLKVLVRSSLFIKSHPDQRGDIYILGNGPSLNQVLQSKEEALKKKTLLCVNKFPDTPAYTTLQPSYFIVCSPGFYNFDAVDYNVEVRKNIIASYVKNTTWKSTFFVPYPATKNKSFLALFKDNKNISIQYYNTTPIEGLPSINRFFFNRGWGCPRPHNVLIPSILQSINKGFDTIYLLGADHSWLPQISVNDKNEVLLNQQHFYDEATSRARQMHKNEGRGNRNLAEVLHKFMESFRSYHTLNDFARHKKCKIFNLTPNSFIDAFERKNLTDVL